MSEQKTLLKLETIEVTQSERGSYTYNYFESTDSAVHDLFRHTQQQQAQLNASESERNSLAQQLTIANESIGQLVDALHLINSSGDYSAWERDGIDIGEQINSALKNVSSPISADDWISVDDRLPEEDQTVLIYTSTDQIFTCRKPVIDRKNNAEEPQFGTRERVTHWRKLPAKPAAGGA